jgi:hypothetical protein
MAYAANTSPVFSSPFQPIGVIVPATAKTVLTDNTAIASLLNARAAPYLNNRFTFAEVAVEVVANISAGKLWLLETFDGNVYRKRGEQDHLSGAPTSTAKVAPIVFSQFTAASPLIVAEGSEIVIATAVAQTAGSLIAYLKAGRIFG